jgi:hypothetical protein
MKLGGKRVLAGGFGAGDEMRKAKPPARRRRYKHRSFQAEATGARRGREMRGSLDSSQGKIVPGLFPFQPPIFAVQSVRKRFCRNALTLAESVC